jgi:O-antigen ligase
MDKHMKTNQGERADPAIQSPIAALARILSNAGMALSVAIVFCFYVNLPVYLDLTGKTGMSPLVWVAVLFALLGAYSAQLLTNWRVKWHPVHTWVGLYFLFCSVSLFWVNDFQLAMAPYRSRVLSALILLVLFLLLQQKPEIRRKARWAILCGSLVAAGCNIAELFSPFLFVAKDSIYSNPGRAAGFYINANQAGAALAIGAVLTSDLLSIRFRKLYFLLITFCILITVSRAAILGWVGVLVLWLVLGRLQWKSFLYGTSFIGAIVILIGKWLLSQIGQDTSVQGFSNLITRLNWILDPFAGGENSQNERVHLAALAWSYFKSNPWLGRGLGATETWSASAAPHNMYLTYIAEHGIAGILVLPSLVGASVSNSFRRHRHIAVPFVAFTLFWGLFSHNIIGSHFYLACFAVMAAIGLEEES